MRVESLPVAIAVWSALVTLAVFAGVALAISVASWFGKGPKASPGGLVGRIAGVTAILLLPIGFLSFVGLLAAALVDAVGTPPIAFPFVTIAGLAGLRAAKDMRSGEMAGCSKTIASVAACYVAIWGAVAWWMTSGPTAPDADLASLRWLQPPLAALPFAFALWRVAGRKRKLWLLFGSLAFLSAYFALWFFTIEAGFAADLLPASDWLRFPLAALAAGLLLVLVPLFNALQAKRPGRARRMREVARRAIPVALLTLPMGLAWAGARAAVAAF